MCTTRVCAVCLTADKNGSHFGVQREPSASHMDREIWLGAALPAQSQASGAGLGITPMSKNSKNSFRTRDRTDARSAPTLDAAGGRDVVCEAEGREHRGENDLEISRKRV